MKILCRRLSCWLFVSCFVQRYCSSWQVQSRGQRQQFLLPSAPNDCIEFSWQSQSQQNDRHDHRQQQQPSDEISKRRQFLSEQGKNLMIGSLAFATTLQVAKPPLSVAAVTDETDAFADTWWSNSPRKTIDSTTTTQSADDEVSIFLSKQEWSDLRAQQASLGLELAGIEFRTNRRVYVKSVRSWAATSGIQPNWIVIAVNGQTTERTDAKGVILMISRALKTLETSSADGSLELRFRDPFVFQERLRNLSSAENDDNPAVVTTQVAPAGDTTQRNPDGSVKLGQAVKAQDDQQITVEQLQPPTNARLCSSRGGARVDDLLEISYQGMVLQTGFLFDGSAVRINGKAIPGRGDDVTLYFVLGKQPFGQFPPGWDVGLVGMCVGERRRLIIPPVLAYGATGLPRRGIPPDATLQYDVTLVSINGLSTP